MNHVWKEKHVRSHIRDMMRGEQSVLCDLTGPIKPSSYGKKKYILSIIDDFSRIMFIQLLGEKSEAAEELKRTIILKENQTEQRSKRIRWMISWKKLKKLV